MVDNDFRTSQATAPSAEETRRILANLVGQLSDLLEQVRVQVGHLPGEDDHA